MKAEDIPNTKLNIIQPSHKLEPYFKSHTIEISLHQPTGRCVVFKLTDYRELTLKLTSTKKVVNKLLLK